MTPREELFVKVAKHLLTQGVKARVVTEEGTACKYRLGELRCAVGCLIDDAHYDATFEGFGISDLAGTEVRAAVAASVGHEVCEQDFVMLSALQRLHDCEPTAFWKEGLEDIANDFGIDFEAQREAGVLS